MASHESMPERAQLMAQARKRLSIHLLDDNKNSGKNSLRKLRLNAGLSQEQLAQTVGTSQPRIARIEAGREDIGLDVARRLSKALGVDMNSIADALDRSQNA